MEDLLTELYYELLLAGPPLGDVEFWDPTTDALVLEEEVCNYIRRLNGGDRSWNTEKREKE